jgi:general stress protein 26
MKYVIKFICLVFTMLLLIPLNGFSQNTESRDTSNNKLISAAREIMTAAGICALITIDEEGNPRVRAMDPFVPESDFTVWFGTNAKSRKVNQIKNNPRATLYYLDSDASGYVTIHGTAQIVDEPKEKEKRWKDEWKTFYPNNREGYLLIKVTPKWMEVSSNKRGIYSNPTTWQPPVVQFE